MKRLAWLTDIHLNFVTSEGLAALVRDVHEARPDAVLVGGDIGEADSFAGFLGRLAELLDVSIYFVLGNHDYYRGSIAEIRRIAMSLSRGSQRLTWLSAVGVVRLTNRSVFIGHGGWGDGRNGDFLQSNVVLSDYGLIRELREAHGAEVSQPESVLTAKLLERLHELGDEAADHFRTVLPQALETGGNVLVLTHVPPFRDACWHEGRLSDGNWSPHFTCQAVGDVLLEFMQRHPDRKMTVLCGHTHSSGHVRILDNLEVFTGDARYGQPMVQQTLEVE
jgi:3',5'-cyclic AMP phosphodiesterase CpdA